MKFVKETFVLVVLAVFGMTSAAAGEALVMLDVEVSVQEAPSSPKASHPPKLFSGTFERTTSLGKEAKIVHKYEINKSFVLALTPALTKDWKVALAFVLTDQSATGETRLAGGKFVVPIGEAAIFHSNNFEHRRTWHFSVTPRR